MSNTRGWRAGAAATLTAVALVASVAGPAAADPTNSAGTPAVNRSLSGTGANTTQDLYNGLSAKVLISGARVIGSFDATVPAGDDNWIQTRRAGTAPSFTGGGTHIPRPNSSTEGRQALFSSYASAPYNSWRGNSFLDVSPFSGTLPLTRGVEDTTVGNLAPADLQFARSSSGASTYLAAGEPTVANTYSYIPLAVDAVTWAKDKDNVTLPANFTKADLTAIYSAANGASTVLSTGTYTVGKEGTGAQIVPLIPVTDSYVNSYWRSELGLSTFGPAVASAYAVGGAYAEIVENDGSAITAVPNSIMPFSIASHIGQSRAATINAGYAGVNVVDRRFDAKLGNVNSKTPLSGGLLNTSFDIKRAVFTIARTHDITPTSNLNKVFGPVSGTPQTTGLAYTAVNGANNVIAEFGFGQLPTSGAGLTIGTRSYVAGDIIHHRANL